MAIVCVCVCVCVCVWGGSQELYLTDPHEKEKGASPSASIHFQTPQKVLMMQKASPLSARSVIHYYYYYHSAIITTITSLLFVH